MSETPSNEPKPKVILSRFSFDPGAWQPFTGGGVARFAQSGPWRAGISLGIGSVTVGVAFGWLLLSTWWPVVQKAAERFPESPVLLRSGRLDWKEPGTRILAEGAQLGIAHRPAGSEAVGLASDLQAELTPTHLRIVGIAGYVDLPWHRDLELELDRQDAIAGWGAWRLPVLAAGTAATAASVFLLGVSLATALFLPAWLLQMPFRRGVSLGGAWKMVAAAYGPSALLLAAAIAAYSVRWVPWPGLLLVVAGHPLATLLLLVWGISRHEAPPRPAKDDAAGTTDRSGKAKAKAKAPKGNPFKPAAPQGGKDPGGKTRKKNPFQGDTGAA